MSAAAPWSVKGIDPKAREIAKDLARRSGMTLGEWLNSMIMEDDDEGYATLPRRAHAADSFERRSRSRRMDDAYAYEGGGAPGGDQTWQRLSASVEAMAERLEASERRSTVAIQGIDQAVSGLVRRLESSDGSALRRIDDIADELKEGHKRLRRFEMDTGPKTAEQIAKVETGLGGLAGRLYDMEERQRTSVNELRQRMDAVEKAAGPGAGGAVLAQVGQRLDSAQAQTGEALRRLEQAFAGLDHRLRATEGRVEPEGSREAARFEKLAEALTRQVEANRTDMMHRLETAQAEGRMERIERAVAALGDHLKASEQRSAQGIEAMGREVLRIGQNLHGRVQKVEADGAAQLDRLARDLSTRVDRDMARHAQAVEQRLVSGEDRHALALEKLGVEITRISDRLSDRIAQSERRSAEAIDDIGKRLSESSERIEQRYDRASGELAERMRLSEERTAALLSEARDSLERRTETPAAARETPLPEPAFIPTAPAQADWRAAAFPDAGLEGEDFWSADPVDAAPFPMMEADQPAPAVAAAAAPEPALRASAGFSAGDPQPVTVAAPFGAASPAAFGGADVSDALAATAPDAFEEADAFEGETEFVDPRALRAAAAAGRAASTRQTIDAARAAMTAPADEPQRSSFGLKRGGKSRLQERMDKQASREGSTVRKALGASAVAVMLTGGVYGYAKVTGQVLPIPGLDGPTTSSSTTPLAALASTPAAMDADVAADLFNQAQARFDGGDPAEGLALLTRSAEGGYPPAQLQLADMYDQGGSGVEADPQQARRWSRLAAEAGDPRGMHFFGMALYQGIGGPRNPAEGLTWLERAAGLGLVDSQYNTGQIYETGAEGVPANQTDALKWYLIAGRSGDEEAQGAAARLSPQLNATARRAAQNAAQAFTTEPLG